MKKLYILFFIYNFFTYSMVNKKVDQIDHDLKNKKHACSFDYQQFHESLKYEDNEALRDAYDSLLRCLEDEGIIKMTSENKKR